MAIKMKDSGIQWIGEIPSHWELKRFKAIFLERKEKNDPIKTDFILSLGAAYGVVPYSEKEGGGNKAKEDLTDYRLAYPNDIVMNSMNIISGSVGISKYFGCVSPVYYMLYPRIENVNSDYFCYLFQTKAFQRSLLGLGNGILMKESSTGNFNTVRMRISMDKLGVQPLPLPPIEEQNKIAESLKTKCDEIDLVIAKTKSTIEEYRQFRESVIAEAVTKGIRKDRKLKESGVKWIAEIPDDWVDIAPKALFAQRKEKAKAGEKQLTASQQHGVIYQDEYMELTGTKIVTVEKDFDILKHVEAGDFVISMRSFQGGLEYSEKSGSISSAYVMLIPNLELVYPRFYKWLFKSSVYINALQSTSNLVRDGQAMRYSNFAQVRLYTVPLDEQKEIADYLDKKCAEIDTLIEKKTALLEEMESYKKSVIYEYVTGKKEVTV